MSRFRLSSTALSALGALEKLAQNGLGIERPAQRASEFLSRQAGRILALCALLFALIVCYYMSYWPSGSRNPPVLEMMSTSWQLNSVSDRDFLNAFGKRNGIETQYLPNLDTVDSRLLLYRRLLREHSSQPDLLQIDVVWSGILADDLIDLTPYLKSRDVAFVPAALRNFSVRGRVIALPSYLDAGVLYYRPALLKKYGFTHPPNTWEELEYMAQRIQDGERRHGHKDFWGYIWQGGAYEGLTCNALEWQASAGAGNFLESSSVVHVRDRRFAAALRRAAHWIGTISPPGEYVYQEPDAVNIWNAGQAAFMRNWISGYGSTAHRAAQDGYTLAIAPLPGGPGGRVETLGGHGIAVSRYAANRDLAIKALLEITDRQHVIERLAVASGIPFTWPDPVKPMRSPKTR